MRFDWKPEYNALVSELLKAHFGGGQGVTRVFPCMRDNYPWGDHRPPVVDSRVPAKNNTEYHGLERHAMQYHATAQYEYAYHHWLLAAAWRRDDMMANNFRDQDHINAIRYALKHALYNKALHEWQVNVGKVRRLPVPEDFELNSDEVDRKEQKALKEIENFTLKKRIT